MGQPQDRAKGALGRFQSRSHLDRFEAAFDRSHRFAVFSLGIGAKNNGHPSVAPAPSRHPKAAAGCPPRALYYLAWATYERSQVGERSHASRLWGEEKRKERR